MSANSTVETKETKQEICNICCNEMNRKDRRPIACMCGFVACHACHSQYLLSDSVTESHCMSCKVQWGRKFLAENFTKKFMNARKTHREQVLFHQQLALLPATQIIIENQIRIRHLNEECESIRSLMQAKQDASHKPFEYPAARNHMNLIASKRRYLLEECERLQRLNPSDYSEEQHNTIVSNYFKDFESDMHELQIITMKHTETELDNYLEISRLTGKLIELNAEKTALIGNREDKKSEWKHQRFVCACPKDDCNGLVSDKWRCGICDTKICSHCHIDLAKTKKADHECDPNLVESVKAIANDSKQCPSCHALIFRISGCDMMFCTMCHTPFNWRTGKITNGAVHNPHYFEWQARGGRPARTHGDVICGGLPGIGEIANYSDRRLRNLYQGVAHIREIDLPKFNTQVMTDNLDLRTDYLRNKITQDEFKRTLQRREKRSEFKREIYMILDMYLTTAEELFRQLAEDYRECEREDIKAGKLQRLLDIFAGSENYTRVSDAIKKFWREYNPLIQYANASIVETKRHFGYSCLLEIIETKLMSHF